MSIRQLPSARWTVPGTSGGIAANWYVYTYQPGTTTPKATYADYLGATPLSNPFVLDSRGEKEVWWDGTYKVAVYTGDMTAGGVLVWTQDNYGEGTTSVLQGNFNLVLNGSFEQDTNGDGIPDDWTVTAYTGGTVVLDTADQIHGAQSLKFTSVGTGGGFADTEFFEVEGSKTLPVSFAIKASVATVHNQVDVVWYTAAQAVISTTTLYTDSATNPLTWTDKSYSTAAPATARYAKIRLYGCKDDSSQAGSAWFDNVLAESIAQTWFPYVSSAVTSTGPELSILSGVTVTAANINTLANASVVGWHLGAAAYHGKNYEILQDSFPAIVQFSPDGATMYILGLSNKYVYQYSLSTAWDVSTSVYSNKSFLITETISPTWAFFSSDGSKMYVISNGLATVFQYSLSTPWDVSTASYASKSYSVGPQEATPYAVSFSSDGSLMYAVGSTNKTVYQYSLSTPWDVSTASYASKSYSVATYATLPLGLCFGDSGKMLFILSNGSGIDASSVHQYMLKTAWDVSIAGYTRTFSADGQTGGPTGVAFNDTGTKMYVSGQSISYVYQYGSALIAPDL